MKVRSIALTFGIVLAVGIPLAATAGPTPGGPDGDSDGVEDAFDNCTEIANASQVDIDHDGCGDACDKGPIGADATGDTIVGIPDFNILASQFGAVGPNNPADFTGDNIVGIPDFNILAAELGNFIGPSGITNALRDTVECPL